MVCAFCSSVRSSGFGWGRPWQCSSANLPPSASSTSTSAQEYLPRRFGPLPTLEDANDIHELVRKVQANEPVPAEHRRLISPGATMGGARPKALLNIAGEQWVIKFSDGEPTDTPLIEHAAMTLAKSQCTRSNSARPTALANSTATANA
jgi:serine/threonine-protein kinase HipA